MRTENVELTTEILEPVPLDPEVLDHAAMAFAAAIDEANQRRIERFSMMQPPQTLKQNTCDCRGVLHHCEIVV